MRVKRTKKKGRRKSSKHSANKRRSNKSSNSKRNSTRSRRQKGGNYEKDPTVRMLDGLPIKSPSQITVTVPGLGVLSGADYIKHMNSTA